MDRAASGVVQWRSGHVKRALASVALPLPIMNREISTNPRPAPLRYRLAAMVYDALVVLAMWVATVVGLVTVVGDAVVGAWVQSLLFVELYALLAFCWCGRGQTLGMAAWRLRVVSRAPLDAPNTDVAASPAGGIRRHALSSGQALRRFIAGLASIATLGLGFLWMWFDREGRSWPDRFSNSVIVREAPPLRPSKRHRRKRR